MKSLLRFPPRLHSLSSAPAHACLVPSLLLRLGTSWVLKPKPDSATHTQNSSLLRFQKGWAESRTAGSSRKAGKNSAPNYQIKALKQLSRMKGQSGIWQTGREKNIYLLLMITNLWRQPCHFLRASQQFPLFIIIIIFLVTAYQNLHG